MWPELATPSSPYWREYDRCMRERVPVQFQAWYAPLDLWTGVSAYPIRTGGIAVFFRDITAVKHAEREQARLAAIVESSDDAIDLRAVHPGDAEPRALALARSEGGLGLGLALVKGLTELHGGRVSATSGVAGIGAEFTVELPLVEAVDRAQPSRRVAAARRRYRVLVVDDNMDAAESLAELVRLFGHEVEVAYDGPSAVASVEARRPDVVLCDLGLPGMDGYEVARALRAKLEDRVQLVAVSGYAQAEDVKRSADAGFDAHIAKPPDPAHIERLFS